MIVELPWDVDVIACFDRLVKLGQKVANTSPHHMTSSTENPKPKKKVARVGL